MRIAFIGIGQSYPTHVWMSRMREMLADRIVVNIDDLRNTDRKATLRNDTEYVPRKLSRPLRALRALGLTTHTNRKLRCEWMLQTLSKHDVSIVFVHFLDFAAQFADVWRQLNIPVVVHCHGYDILWDVCNEITGVPVHPEGYQERVRELPENVWFIANSTFTRDQLLQLEINPNKVFVKRFGVPLADRPKDLGTDHEGRVLYLGRLVTFKGPLETVQAFSQVRGCDRVLLDIAGDGVLAEPVDELIRRLELTERVCRHGAVSRSRAAELRQQAAVFTAHNKVVQPGGQVEAFGVSLLEAMGEGVPAVTGRTGGIPDFIDSGVNGLLFEPGDVQTHAQMLSELLASKRYRESLGAAAWESVRDNWQAHHELEDLNRIFEVVSQQVAAPTLNAHELNRAA